MVAVHTEAAKVTLAYAGSFLFNILIQVYGKIRAVRHFKQLKAAGATKEKFNRYTSDIMLAGDRSVGNFVEWQGIFLSLFWANALVTGKEIELGYVYVAIRLAYPILAQLGGITQAGPRPLIFLATIPGYYVLLRYMYLLYQQLYVAQE
ncbi:hypothetical protein THRCLA_22126 [Thraustotheca clavata]|uniref:Uncharacterized protein n=1 Tax=Thraustotheca clavata TaxID=74557 RepID=A0A1V9ZCE9_9STRA|nr:hypothetical protein THRCLA_22126 [Thraustotheca clavata]